MCSTEHFPRSLVDFKTMSHDYEVGNNNRKPQPIEERCVRVGQVRNLKYGAREYDVEFSSSPRLSAHGCTFVHMGSPRTSRVARTAFIDTELNDEFAQVVGDVSLGLREEASVRLTSYVNDTIAPSKYGITVQGRVRKNTAGDTELHLERKVTVTVPRSDTLTMVAARHILEFEDLSDYQ